MSAHVVRTVVARIIMYGVFFVCLMCVQARLFRVDNLLCAAAVVTSARAHASLLAVVDYIYDDDGRFVNGLSQRETRVTSLHTDHSGFLVHTESRHSFSPNMQHNACRHNYTRESRVRPDAQRQMANCLC